MNLKLLSTDKAVLFSFPAQSQPEADAVAFLVGAAWSERDAKEHVDAAVQAGAYTRTRGVIHPEGKRKGVTDVAN